MKVMQTSQIFGFPILSVRKQEFFDSLDSFFLENRRDKSLTLKIFTPNPEQLVVATNDKIFSSNLSKANYLLPDGIGLVYASKILSFFGKTKEKIKERIAGVEVVEHLLDLIKEQKLKALIIGGRDYSNAEDVEFSSNLFWTEGYQDKFEILSTEEAVLTEKINELKPDLVFIAFGAPDQENWIINHEKLLEENKVRIAMAVGGSFDFIFNRVKRAPVFVQKLGFEWLWRLIKQPWRRHRQLRLLSFIWLVIKEIFKR